MIVRSGPITSSGTTREIEFPVSVPRTPEHFGADYYVASSDIKLLQHASTGARSVYTIAHPVRCLHFRLRLSTSITWYMLIASNKSINRLLTLGDVDKVDAIVKSGLDNLLDGVALHGLPKSQPFHSVVNL